MQDRALGAQRPRFYHPELDALRFFAFLAVFLHHALPRVARSYVDLGIPPRAAGWLVTAVGSGGYGVDLFFVLSSYLITELLSREQSLRGSVDVRSFYIRRALRIWPLYYAFLGMIVVIEPLLVPDHEFPWVHRLSFMALAGNWSCALLDYPRSVAALLWSVSIEEQFYLVWPLVVATFRGGRLAIAAGGLLVVSTLTRAALVAAGVPHPGIWCNTFARLDPIACGALLSIGLRGRNLRMARAGRWGLAVLGLILWLGAARLTSLWRSSSLVGYPAIALACTLIVASTLRDSRGESEGRARWHPLVYLGKISYGLYVFHVFALALVDILLAHVAPAGGPGRWALRSSLGLAATMLLAAGSYRWLETPFLRLKERFTVVPSGPPEDR